MVKIYFLHKGDNIPFYIGKTINIKSRLKEHKTVYGSNVLIEIVDEVYENNWEFWERHYISLFKSWGFKLTNGNNGGGGPTSQTEETKKLIRDKVSKANKGKSKPEGFGEIMRKIHKGRIRTEESKLKQSQSILGSKHSKVRKDKGILKLDEKTKQLISDSNSKPIIQYNLGMSPIKEYKSSTEAYQKTGINSRRIVEVLKGRGKTAGGFIWRYKN